MSCLATLLGASIGLLFGGPLGAIAGAAFASLASSLGSSEPHRFGENPYLGMWNQRLRPQQHAQMTFFVGTFSMLGKLAAVDGSVTTEERAKVEEFMDKNLHLDPETRASAVQIFEAAVHSDESFYSIANQFFREFYSRPEFFELLIDIMLQVAVADQNGMSREEETLIVDAVHIFRFSETRYQQLKSRYVRQGASAYAVLGCAPDASVDQIKKAYRHLVNEYHPDKIAAKGLPDEFKKVAAEKFQEIQDAYGKIRDERGF